ncbi:hypothetical protein HK405_008516 [Cladochytrium tenue]|nr:hypothetical protein HK405_008516 [Cladochytrium tenue]
MPHHPLPPTPTPHMSPPRLAPRQLPATPPMPPTTNLTSSSSPAITFSSTSSASDATSSNSYILLDGAHDKVPIRIPLPSQTNPLQTVFLKRANPESSPGFGSRLAQDRLWLEHEISKVMFGRLFHSGQESRFHAASVVAAAMAADAPPPPALLDIGCGPGMWARDVARAFPGVVVVGLDVEEAYLSGQEGDPPNLRLVQGDVLAGLPFPDGTFDLVRQACMVSSFPMRVWPDVVKELQRVVKPGGFVELLEPYFPPVPRGPAAKEVGKISVDLEELLSGAGLQTYTEQMRSVPVVWGGQIGTYVWMNMNEVFTTLRPKLVEAGVATADEFTEVVARLQREAVELQSNWNWYMACAQRPV